MKHTKEYAEKLAEKYAEDENSCYNNDLNGFKNGYMQAIEETNVKELLEALKALVNKVDEIVEEENMELTDDDKIVIEKSKNAIKKAE